MLTLAGASPQYSFSLTTFSPSGKLVQIEYALNAVAAGATSLGIVATDGVVIATEKKLPSILVDETTVQKISVITPHIGVVYSGMGPDFRVLVRKARKTAQTYYRLYHEHIPVAQLVRETAAVMQEFTRGCARARAGAWAAASLACRGFAWGNAAPAGARPAPRAADSLRPSPCSRRIRRRAAVWRLAADGRL
jgi:hypothetical protein